MIARVLGLRCACGRRRRLFTRSCDRCWYSGRTGRAYGVEYEDHPSMRD